MLGDAGFAEAYRMKMEDRSAKRKEAMQQQQILQQIQRER